jgi:hypothetical protein
MLNGLLTVVGCWGAVFILYGWGSLVRRLLKASLPWSLTVIVGLGVLLAIGGVLNLVRVVSPGMLDLTIFIGAGLSCVQLIKSRPDPEKVAHVSEILGLISIPVAFLGAYLLPTTTFLWVDDFEKYLAYPLRMLATGSVAGSTLSSMGWETFGGQAYLQAFVVAHLPLTYINAVDEVFGLFLCLMLIMTPATIIGRSDRARIAEPTLLKVAPRLAGLAAILCIPTLYINVSTIYIGAALVGGVMLAMINHQKGAESLPEPFPIGLLLAALASLKMTFIPFVAAAVVLALIGIATSVGLRNTAMWGLKIVGWSALALSPWVMVHYQNWMAIFGPGQQFLEAAIPSAPTPSGWVNLFSTQPAFRGQNGTLQAFTWTGLLAAGAASLMTVTEWRRSAEAKRGALVALAFTLAALVLYLGITEYTLIKGFKHGIRLIVPFLIGVLVGLTALTAALSSVSSSRTTLAVSAALIIVTMMFVDTLPPRTSQLRGGGSLLPSPLSVNEKYLSMSRVALSEASQESLRRIQAMVPEGAPLLAWINTTFQLDFGRNRIIDVDFAGFAVPWARVPDVRFVLWEYPAGGGMYSLKYYKKDAATNPFKYEALSDRRALRFANELSQLKGRVRMIYDDGHFVLFETPIPLSEMLPKR